MMDIQLKRVYDPPDPGDGFRILVDRLWPRGMSKDKLRADLWLRDAAPSNDLRQWFNHDPARWQEFQTRYRAELDAHPEVLAPLLAAAVRGKVTLLFSTREMQMNHAVFLKEYLLHLSEKK